MKMVKTRSGDVSPEDKLCINAAMPVKDTTDVKDGIEEDENDMTVSSQHQESSDEKDVSYRPGYGRELRNRFVFGHRAKRVSSQGVRVSSRSQNRRFAEENMLDVSQDELTDDDDDQIFSPRERRVRRKKSRHHSGRRMSRSSRAHRSQVIDRGEMHGRVSLEDKTPDNQEGEGTQTLHGYPNMYGGEKPGKAGLAEDGGGGDGMHKRRLRTQETVAYQVYMTDDDKEDEKVDEEDEEEENKKMERGMKRTRSALNEVDTSGGMEGNGEMYKDMYSRVKRRRPIKRYLNGENTPNTRGMEDDPTETQSSQSSTDDESGHENNNVVRHSKYSLRKTKPTIDRYQVNNDPPRKGRSSRVLRSVLHKINGLHCRPRRRSTSSSSSSSSSGADRFERGQHKKTKARSRCPPPPVPLNMDVKGLPAKKSKPSAHNLADVDPMSLDRSIVFANVGGLHEHIRCLQEMVVFPMMYREVFDRFHIQPAKGVLFHGPPGTGKTLLARALANECSQGDRKVAFFMRKGADCLTKWVGESERQLRLLFEQAYQMRPSIIFFDEIDGLAPVRSSKQEQIHASIVSTLLALMDGLDSRGDVVVIGATNRIDAIDPALRRPGRFDRELFFPLPAQQERQEILRIHVSKWEAPPTPELITTLAEQAAGYCGSDLRALCSEAVLQGLRRRYPQIYKSNQKLLLNPNAVQVESVDFLRAKSTIVPAAHRSTPSYGRKLPPFVEPLLKNRLEAAVKVLAEVFSHGVSRSVDSSKLLSATQSVHRPHLLIAGPNEGRGQTFLARALLHFMEHVTVHTLDLETLFRTSSQTVEEACIQLFNEARRNLPSIIYVPSIGRLWRLASETLRSIFLMKLEDIDPSSPVLLLATSESPCEDLPPEVSALFSPYRDEVLSLPLPTAAERRAFFAPLILEETIRPPTTFLGDDGEEVLEVLPLAPPPSPVKLSVAEQKVLNSQEEKTLRELRIFLRDCCSKLARNRLFFMFTKPVDVEIVPDYLNIIKQPMDLETMMTKIDMHRYSCAQDFLDDIDLVVSNALEYNPDRSGEDKLIRHRACSLRDRAYAMIKEEMDTDYEEQCKKIKTSRTQRAESPSRFVPDFIRTLPAGAGGDGAGGVAGRANQLGNHAVHQSSQSTTVTNSSQSQTSVPPKSAQPVNGVRTKSSWRLDQSGGARKKHRSRNSWQRGLIAKKRRVVASVTPAAAELAESRSSKVGDGSGEVHEAMVNGVDSVDTASSGHEAHMKSPVVLTREELGESEFTPRLSAKPKRSDRSSRSSVNACPEPMQEDALETIKSLVDHHTNLESSSLTCSLPTSSQDKSTTSPNSKSPLLNSSAKSKQDVSPPPAKTEHAALTRVIYDQHALDQLLSRVVRLTDGCSFAALLDVHARLRRHVESCCRDPVKIDLIELLSKELDRFEVVRRKKAGNRCS